MFTFFYFLLVFNPDAISDTTFNFDNNGLLYSLGFKISNDKNDSAVY